MTTLVIFVLLVHAPHGQIEASLGILGLLIQPLFLAFPVFPLFRVLGIVASGLGCDRGLAQFQHLSAIIACRLCFCRPGLGRLGASFRIGQRLGATILGRRRRFSGGDLVALFGKTDSLGMARAVAFFGNAGKLDVLVHRRLVPCVGRPLAHFLQLEVVVGTKLLQLQRVLLLEVQKGPLPDVLAILIDLLHDAFGRTAEEADQCTCAKAKPFTHVNLPIRAWVPGWRAR